jgi:hypothetical protein
MAIVAATVSTSSSAWALSNASFEGAGLADWQTVGQVGQFGQFKDVADPSHLAHQAIVFTNRFDPQPRNIAATAAEVNSFFNLDISAQLGGVSIHDGSGIAQTFNLAQSATLTFDWALGHRFSQPGGNDVAFAVLDNLFYLLGDLNSAIFTKFGSDEYSITNYLTYTDLPALEAGQHTIGFGVVNVGTSTGRSALLLDNVQLSLNDLSNEQNTPVNENSPVPEPVTSLLTLLGLGALGMSVRRRRRG